MTSASGANPHAWMRLSRLQLGTSGLSEKALAAQVGPLQKWRMTCWRCGVIVRTSRAA